jgi:predicted nucleotidyltransferase
MRSDLPNLARVVGVPERSLRRAVQRGTVRVRRPGPRQAELDPDERQYLLANWPLIAAVSEALRVERNVRLAVLFGSSARGGIGEGSDVDLLVSLARRRPLYCAQLAVRLSRAVGRDVDIVLLEQAREREPVLLDEVLNEGRPIVDRDAIWSELLADRANIRRAADVARKARHSRAANAVFQLVESA